MIKHISVRLLVTLGAMALVSCARLAAPAPAEMPPAAATNAMAAEALARSIGHDASLRDPSTIVKCKNEFWVFYTGRGVMSYHSKDLVNWERGPRIFTNAPDWVAQTVPANRGMSYWAPDVSYVGGRYLLYYSASSFGKNTSGIGLATNPTLDPADPAYHWTDQGVVVSSVQSNNFNTIDPAIFHDANGSLWLSFGSYWSGIKLVQLDPHTGKRLSAGGPVFSLAHSDSIEASYIYQRRGYYYLFLNWGSCCSGARSTYNIRIGRSAKVTGPYLDKNGVNMLDGGGSLFLASMGPLIGPGHAGIIVVKGKSWFSCHFEYDGTRGGRPCLGLMPLRWNAQGWPEADLSAAK